MESYPKESRNPKKDGKGTGNKKDSRAGSCYFCSHYVYDEEDGCYVCMVQLDEDEMERFLRGVNSDCPFYRRGDDYETARRQ